MKKNLLKVTFLFSRLCSHQHLQPCLRHVQTYPPLHLVPLRQRLLAGSSDLDPLLHRRWSHQWRFLRWLQTGKSIDVSNILLFNILCVSQIFAAIMFFDDCETKNPCQNSLSLWRRQNWKLVKILGREINFEAVGSPTQAKIVRAHSKSVGFGPQS